MNPMQIMAMLQNSGNPMQMMMQMAQQNPMMGRGKNEVQLKETVRNLAKQRGMSDEQLSQMLSNFGLTL